MEYEAFPHKHFPVSGPSSVTQLILEDSKGFKTDFYHLFADLQGIVIVVMPEGVRCH